MSEKLKGGQSGNARACIVSLRNVNGHAAWCSHYEFEDVICQIDAVDLFSLERGTGFDLQDWIARRLIWKQGLRRLVPHMNAGLRPLELQRDYELFAFICMNPADLIYLGAVKNWQMRCEKKICLMAEFYTGWLREYAFHLQLLEQFDAVGFNFDPVAPAVQKVIGRPCAVVPPGVDALQFSPFPNPPRRTIDVYSIGRRPAATHKALLAMSEESGFHYVYDTIPGDLIRPMDYRDHRKLMANFGKRSKLFVTYPAKVDVSEETRGQSEAGSRFYEGAAMGAVLVGEAPKNPAFAERFGWGDAVVEIGTTETEIHRSITALLADPDRCIGVGQRNAIEALRKFDWAYRWKALLGLAGMRPSELHLGREALLAETAGRAERGEIEVAS